MTKTSKRSSPRRQYGVAPYRVTSSGSIEVLLITTRETKRWMVPKGWPSKKLGAPDSAAREAFEEAGILGEVGPSIGEFQYLKTMRTPPHQLCLVELFAMEVREELEDWPEKDQRTRRWFSLREAAEAVQEEHLREILAELPDRLPQPA